ncbi:MAG: AMP-binding protein [Caldilineaceae bacterium]
MDEQCDRFAAARTSGVGKGDRVAIMLPNIPQQVIAYFGTAQSRAQTVVNTNPTYTPRELLHQLEDKAPRPLCSSVAFTTGWLRSGIKRRLNRSSLPMYRTHYTGRSIG